MLASMTVASPGRRCGKRDVHAAHYWLECWEFGSIQFYCRGKHPRREV